MKLIIAYTFLLIVLIASCARQNKSDEFSAEADGRVLFQLIQEYKESNDDNFPKSLRDLDYSSLRGVGLLKDGKPLVDNWQYSGRSSKEISPSEIILRKSISHGRVVSVQANGKISVD